MIYGENGNDRLFGKSGNDSISAGDGEDLVRGNSGNDSIYGEDGHDQLFGDDGDDLIAGGNGDDEIHGLDGDDEISGNEGHDFLNGNKGNDQIRGGHGDDFLRGHSGEDTLDGGDDRDDLAGGSGADQIRGGAGNDDFVNVSDDDSLDSDADDNSADGDFEIHGEISQLNTATKSFNMLGITVSYAGARVEGQLANGLDFKAEGRFVDGIVAAYEVERDDRQRVDNFEARGVITQIDEANQVVEMLGLSIQYSNAEVHTELAIGSAIFVEGNLQGGTVTAREIYNGAGQNGTSIDRNFELRAAITNLDTTAQTFDLFGITVDYSNAFLEVQLTEGQFVKTKGDLESPGLLLAREVEMELDDDRNENVEAVGVVFNLNTNDQTFELLGLTVDYSNADLDSPLENGVNVEVDGWYASSTGSIAADKVDIDN